MLLHSVKKKNIFWGHLQSLSRYPINLDDTKYWFKGCVDFAIQVRWYAY